MVSLCGVSAGSGRSEKQWLQSPDGEIGLFKYPKVDPVSSTITTEYVSEHLPHKIGEIIGVETANVSIGTYNKRIGCMSHLINKSDEAIVEGAVFITGKHPDYDLDLMRETGSGRYYCLDHFLEVSTEEAILEKWIEMMLFDYLIGNSDRHQNNWAILFKVDENNKNLHYRFCSLYDNGSSLCSYVRESDIDEILGKDKNRFDALCDRKSKSMIRLDGYDKKRPTHLDVVKYLIRTCSYARLFSEHVIKKMSDERISSLLKPYSILISDDRIKLIESFLGRKVHMLNNVLLEGKL